MYVRWSGLSGAAALFCKLCEENLDVTCSSSFFKSSYPQTRNFAEVNVDKNTWKCCCASLLRLFLQRKARLFEPDRRC